jgi:hypothetical protein
MPSNVANVSAADVDGDGKPDVFVALGDGSVALLRNLTVAGDSSASFAPAQILPAEGGASTLLATDVNGDGRPDLIVGNSGANSVSVLPNTQYRCTLVAPSAYVKVIAVRR